MLDNFIILSCEIVVESCLFGVECLVLCFFNGEEWVYECLCMFFIFVVLIVVVKENGNVVLICEYCCGIGWYELMLFKGVMDYLGEVVFEVVNWELMEEVGYGVYFFMELKVLLLLFVYMGYMIYIVLV